MSAYETTRLTPVAAPAGPDISVVVPVVGFHDDPEVIWEAFAPELRKLGRSFEFLFVADGDQDTAAAQLAGLRARHREVSAYRLGRVFGEAQALSVGFRRARGRVVVTLSPYLQVLPSELGPLLTALDENTDLVVTRRTPAEGSHRRSSKL